MRIDKKALRTVLVSAINDSRSRDPKGVDSLVDQLVETIGADNGLNTHKLAWTKLTELFIILSKASCPALGPDDILKIMQYLLTSSVCIKDSTTNGR